MSEQWFLDLDGVRSGPYQTSEVMSLVAEGEILPHHQIATDLKSQKWMTILEWRLNQNRAITEPKTPEPKQVEKPIEKPVETVKAPEPIVPEVKKEIKEEVPVEAKKPLKEVAPIHVAPTIPTAPAPANGKTKRDPMAEMFDVIQNTKQKREVKSQQTHAHAHAQNTHAPTPSSTSGHSEKTTSSSGNLGKTILIGAIITIVGFALGQWFQHQSQKLPEPAPTAKVTSTPTPASDTPVKTTDETGREVMEVRTDKMIIRAPVNANNNAAASPSPEHGKDIQELKDLKKELLELKALKEEIRGTGDSRGRLDNTGPGPNNIKAMDNSDGDPNSPDGATDENGNPVNPESTEHY